MADVDNMTAAELRTKLAEYGLPVMPITASTRNLMAKKLKMLMENKSDSKNADSRRSLAKYSSGEDSDLDVSKTSKEKAKNRRATVGGAMLPPASSKLRKSASKKSDSPAKLDNDRDSESETEPVKTQEEVKTVITRITRTYKPVDQDYETGSDSDVDNPTDSTSKYTSATRHSAVSSKNASSRSDYISSTLPSASHGGESIIKPTVSSYSSYSTSSDLNSIRSRLGLSTDRPAGSHTPGYTPGSYRSIRTEEIDSPYLSDFTRRLSAIKSESRNSLKDSDSGNGGGDFTGKPFYKTAYKKRDYAPDFKTVGEKNVSKNNLVSLAIVGVGLVFFLGVSFLYLGMKSDVTLHIEDKNINIPLCQSTIGIMQPSVNCVKKENVSKATDLMKIIFPELNSRAVAVSCGETEGPIYMTDKDIIQFVEKEYKNANKDQIMEDLHNLHVLILHNPEWGISILAIDAYKQDKSTALSSMEYVLPKRSRGQAALAVLSPSIPWRCSITRVLYYATFISLVVGTLGTVAFLFHKGVKVYIDYNKQRKEQVYSMVERIINYVSNDGSEDGVESTGQTIPVSHIRDYLIPLQNREKMQGIWEEAIKFLEKNESRLRFEVENVAGEEYRSIRWVLLQGSPRANRGPGAPSWQGQAFVTHEGSVNNPIVSLTPCLKIRHMVDKDDKNPNLNTVIRDAILDKCGPNCKILHMEIDMGSCCVYVKCATSVDAGIVHQNLHGWWYKGNLITVKFLRLPRYMDHFPDSPSSGPFLKMSTQ